MPTNPHDRVTATVRLTRIPDREEAQEFHVRFEAGIGTSEVFVTGSRANVEHWLEEAGIPAQTHPTPFRRTQTNPLTTTVVERFVGVPTLVGIRRGGWIEATVTGFIKSGTAKDPVYTLTTDHYLFGGINFRDVDAIVTPTTQEN